MKKLLLGAAAAVMALAACHNNPQDSNKYSITQDFSDSIWNGKTAYIYTIDNNILMDSAVVENQQVKFVGQADSTMLCRVMIDNRRIAQVVLEPGNIHIADSIFPMPTGTPLNDAYTTLESEIREFLKARRKFFTENQATEEAMDSIDRHFSTMFTTAFKKHSNDPVGQYMLMSTWAAYAEDSVKAEALKEVGEWLQQTAAAQRMVKLIEGKMNTAKGKMFTDVEGQDEKGNPISLSAFAGKGKYVLVDMWASWCGPCRMEIPNIARLYNQYKKKGLQVVGIFVWDKTENLVPSMKNEGVTWPQIIDNNNVATNLYGVEGIPHIMLIGPDGTIIKRGLRGQDMIDFIDQIMNKK